MKMLIYCTKGTLLQWHFKKILEKPYMTYGRKVKEEDYESPHTLNGKIVAECDYEVEKIIPINVEEDDYDYGLFSGKDLLKESCLSNDDIYEYLQDDDGEIVNKGYAINIKNLHIFDESKELSDYMNYKITPKNQRYENMVCDSCCGGDCKKCDRWKEWDYIKKAPQNMMYAYLGNDKYILISIKPEWLCKILNGEKTIELRKKVLKEMMSND